MKKENSRRSFIKNISLATVSALALSGCKMEAFDEFLQRNFRTLTKKEKDNIVKKLEIKYKEKYGKEFRVSDKPALDGTLFGYALDLSRCIGCRRCVYACVKENNQSREPQIHWIEVLQMEKEKGIDFADSNIQYNPEKVPEKGYFYVPVQCQQCKNPPCVKVCPVKATWQEPDGITVVDYNWCIGCRYCMAACPYGARHFNWGEPSVPVEQLNTEMHYLGNRPRKKGVVEKCTFCIQRSREGKYPACVEICPVGARKFGNLLDPDSEVRYILENKRVLVLKQELNTQPKFYYFFGI
jgi:Fe-S-cluster-containing dehydrogenase component